MHTRALSLAAILATPTHAQVPEGWYAISGFETSGGASPGGVWVASPRTNAPATRVTGVPGILINGLGANWIEITDDGSGLLCADAPTTVGDPINLWHLTLSGLNVVSAQPVQVATSLPSSPLAGLGAVSATENLAGNVFAFALSATADPVPALAGERIGLFDLTSGSLTPIAFVGPPLFGTWNAITVSNDFSAIYAAQVNGSSTTQIWRIPIDGSPASSVASPGSIVSSLAFESDGTLTYASFDELGRIDLSTGTVTPILSGFSNGHVIESATSSIASVSGSASGYEVRLLTPQGTVSNIATAPAGGWGILSGIDFREPIETYGSTSFGSNVYSWNITPNPGGLPTVGNPNFGITVESTPGTPTASAIWLSLASTNLPALGVTILVDPGANFLTSIPVPPSTSSTLPLALTPNIAGTTFYAQSIHLDGGGLATSNGLRFTVVDP